jgi:hypothetical protein
MGPRDVMIETMPGDMLIDQLDDHEGSTIVLVLAKVGNDCLLLVGDEIVSGESCGTHHILSRINRQSR